MALKKKVRRAQSKIMDKIRGPKKTPAQRENEIKERVAEQIQRMQDIKGILEVMDFSKSDLPAEELEKKTSSGQSIPDYELARRMAVHYLDQAKATEMDTERIDACIRYAANAFAEGVKNGQINKARWGMVALMHLTQYEREDVDETDREQFEEMTAKKEKKAEDYVTMLKACKKLDNRERRKAKLNAEYHKTVTVFEEKREALNKTLETDAGAAALDELEENAHHPISLSMAAAEIDSLLSELSRKDMDILLLRGELREINEQINLIQAAMNQIYQALSEDAYVEDKDLFAKIEEINEKRREEVAKVVKENERLNEAIEAHQNAMKAVLDSSSTAMRTSKHLGYWEELQEREREEKERREAARARRMEQKAREIEELEKQRMRDQEEQEQDRRLLELEQEVAEESLENDYFEETMDEDYQYNEDY